MATKSTDRKINIWINGRQVENSYKGITNAMRKARNELAGMTIGSKDYLVQTKKIQQLQGILDDHRKRQGMIARGWVNIKNNIKQIAVGNFISSFLTGLVGSFQTAFSKITTKISEFEGGMTNVFTLLDDTTFENFGESLKSGSKEVAELGFKMNDTNKALFDAISAGVDAGESIEYLKGRAILAKGGVTSLGTAVDGNTSILNAYNLAVSEAGNVDAAFFSAQKEGKTTVDELASSVGKAAPIAASLGISYQELLSATAALTKKGIATKESITYLKAAFSNLMKPSADAEKILRKFGVPVGASEIKAAGLTEVLTRLNQVIKKNPDAIAKAIPSVEALTAVQALSGEGLEEYQRILQNVQTDIGDNSSLQKAYQKQMESFPNVMAQAREKLNNFAITLGEKLAPYIKKIVPMISGWSKKVLELVDWMMKNSAAIASLIKWIGIAIVAVKGYSVAQKAKLIWDQRDLLMTNALAKAKKVLNNIMAKAPWALAIAGIAAMGAGIYDLYKSITKLSVTQKSVNDVLAKSQELMIEESRRLHNYKSKLRDINTSQKERKKIVTDINNQYGQYLPKLLTEKSSYNEISKALARVNFQLSKKYELQAAEEKALELKKKQLNLELELKKNADKDVGPDWLQSLAEGADKFMGKVTGGAFIAKQFGLEKTYVSDLKSELKETELAYQSIEDRISKIQDGIKTFDHEVPEVEPKVIPPFKPKGSEEDAKKAAKILEDYQKKYAQMREKISDIRRKFNLQDLSEEERALEEIRLKYFDQIEVVANSIEDLEALRDKKGGLKKEELALLSKFYDQEIALNRLLDEELLSKTVEFGKKKLKEREKTEQQIQEILMNEKDREVHTVTKKYQELIKKAEEYGFDTVELYQKMQSEIKALQEGDGIKKDIFGMTPADWEDLQKRFEDIAVLANAAKDLASAYFDYQNQKDQQALSVYEANNTKKKESLDKRLAAGTISEEKHASEVAKLEKELEAEKERIAIKEANRTKSIRSFEAIVNTAAAVIGYLANPGGIPGIALSVAAGATGALQLAAINSASIPQYGDGGRINHPHMALVGEKGSELMLSNKTITGKYGHIAEDLARVQEGKRPRFLDKPVNPNYGGMQGAIGRSTVSTVNNTVVNQVDSEGMKKVEEKITEMSDSILEMTTSIKELKYLKAIISNDQMSEHEDEEVLRKKYSGF